MGQELPSGPDKAQVDLQATVQRDIAAPKAAGDEHIARLRKMVKDLHLENAGATIRLPDAAGVFPSAALSKFPVLVVDTNILRNDVIYFCRNSGKVTTLVNGANSGLLRLFCARHVVSEVKEHYREWCEVAGIAPEEFERRWIKALRTAEANAPSYNPGGIPSVSSVQKAISDAQASIQAAVKAANSDISTANTYVAAAYEAADQAIAAGNCGGGLGTPPKVAPISANSN